ncbi:MAG: tol-pal system protein YbgF [Rhodospirillales bacterium]|nr:MAG: tol-pal system protein YbgF [Rhodospirillales bacterium]
MTGRCGIPVLCRAGSAWAAAAFVAGLVLWATPGVTPGVTPARAAVETGPADDVSRLELARAGLDADLTALRRNIDETATVLAQAAPQAAIARMEARLSALEQDVRVLTGQAEQIGFDVRQMRQRLETAIRDMEMRLERLERQAGVTAGTPETPPRTPTVPGIDAPPDPPVAGAPTPRAPSPSDRDTTAGAPLPEGDPQRQYAHAFGLLRAGDYDRAEAALAAFIARHPDDALSGNARYWLGETHYVRGDYPAAAQAFLEAYQADTAGTKAPDSLLKLGMALARLDKRDEACAAFQQLERSQPEASATIRQKVQEERSRIGCP